MVNGKKGREEREKKTVRQTDRQTENKPETGEERENFSQVQPAVGGQKSGQISGERHREGE